MTTSLSDENLAEMLRDLNRAGYDEYHSYDWGDPAGEARARERCKDLTAQICAAFAARAVTTRYNPSHAKMREALEWYADEANYEWHGDALISEADADGGKRARAALADATDG